MNSKHLFFFLKSVCPHWQPYYNNSVQLFRSVSGWSIAPVSLSLSFFSFFFHANFSLFIPDNYDLVGVGGADGGAQA